MNLKNKIILATALIFPLTVYAQNLVINPSFEDTLQCPNFVSQIDYAVNWHTSVNTPDYYNACNNTSTINPGMVGVPNSARGYQPARTGNAMAGVVIYWTAQPNYREVFYAQLQTPLIAGFSYVVGMYTVLNEDNAMWAVDGGLGIYLSSSPINPSTLFAYTPQIVNPTGNVLNDSLNWTAISGTYVATGGEQYITIGSFIPDAMFTIFNRGGTYPFTSYAIEDVWVIPEDSIPTGINYFNASHELNVYPNPAAIGEGITIQLGDKISDMIITDIFGRVVQSKTVLQNQKSVSFSLSAAGIYFCSLISDNGQVRKKKIIVY